MPKEHAASATEVFWDGFSSKFRKVLRDPTRAKKFLLRTFDPETMMLVVDGSDVLGFLGVTDLDHPMQADEWAAARDIYGFLGALGRSLLLGPLEQKPPPALCMWSGSRCLRVLGEGSWIDIDGRGGSDCARTRYATARAGCYRLESTSSGPLRKTRVRSRIEQVSLAGRLAVWI